MNIKLPGDLLFYITLMVITIDFFWKGLLITRGRKNIILPPFKIHRFFYRIFLGAGKANLKIEQYMQSDRFKVLAFLYVIGGIMSFIFEVGSLITTISRAINNH